MKRIYLITALLQLLLAMAYGFQPKPGNTFSGKVIVDWNRITVNATKLAGLNSNLSTRIEAIEAIAVYDAVNSIRNIGKPYHFYKPPATACSAQAAAAQAAHDVLINYFPTQRSYLDSALQASFRSTSDGPAAAGPSIGAASAADIISLRVNDGSEPNNSYYGPERPERGQYRPTPPNFLGGINQQWGDVKTFSLRGTDQVQPPPPPLLVSDEYRNALNEVAKLGAVNSSTRSAEQTHIALFYKQDAELTVNEAARELVTRHGTSLEDAAFIFFLTDMAEADARIAIWAAKYNYLFWRPVTALNADREGAVNNNYSSWSPLIPTPPHPSYPCGHCGTVSAGLGILRNFYGDDNSFTLHSTTVGEDPRQLESLTKAENENSSSRLFAGVHYRFDNETSQALGQKVAEFVWAKWPRKSGSN